MYQKFECRVKYDKVNANGKDTVAKEAYLLEGVNFSDAEERIHKEMEPYINGEFSLESIKKVSYMEIILSDTGDHFFKARVMFVSVNEESGAERKYSEYMLIQADTVQEADKICKEKMEDSVTDYEIPSVVQTSIVDVFLIAQDEDNGED